MDAIRKFSIGLLVVVFFGAIACQPVSQKNKLTDDGRMDFNEGWKFHLGDDSMAHTPDYDDSEWRLLDLPHDWSIEGEFSGEHPATSQGGALPGGIGWYRKTVVLPDDTDDNQVYIDFDGVYRNSEVWINGHYLGKRPNGYIAFRYDLTPYVRDGKDGKHVVAVRVDNSAQPNSRWYSGSGIYRNVHLVLRNKIGIAHWGAFVTTPAISTEKALVVQQTHIENLTGVEQDVEVEIVIRDADDKEIVKRTGKQVLRDSMTTIDYELSVNMPQLWSVEQPYLYKIITSIYQQGQLLNEHVARFGIRYFDFDVEKGFSLNGKPLKIHGVCMHHDLGALGAAVNVRAMERQLEILREMGTNAIRISHNPPAKDFLDLCDEMGFLVIDEAYDMWRKRKNKFDYHLDFEAWHKRDLEDLVKRDRNHPSVIMWSIGNEIREQFDSTGIQLTRDLVNIVKSQDTTRPVMAALTETDYAKNFIAQAEALDVLGFNYKYADYPKLPINFPGKPLLASETASALQTRGHYDLGHDTLRFWPANGRQKHVENGNPDYTVSAYDHVAAYWGTSHEIAWNAVKQADYLAGTFVWTGFDYLGEPVPYPYPARSSYYGIVDLAGFPKDVYYMYQSEWTDKDVLHIFPHWNWNEGDTVPVWAYYNNADEVELFLNGRSLGKRRKAGDALHVSWDVPYEPGQLKAVSRKSGDVVLERVINTAGKAAQIRLTADRYAIDADGKDLSFVTVEVLDQDGNLVPDAEHLIAFNVKGQGKIAAVDNGYQASLEPFQAMKRKAYKGKCLVIIQSTGEKGLLTLEGHSEGLTDSYLEIRVR
ncbi:beta-galactosidase GalB [Parapedobacter tibetensis]|uniref:beta-galactosidase GalB n=1 Tax=Parapedobacter tibetensis TaxID=2972951 RepID=UPI00214D63A6|nr:beta-galactosidase GalB [Parapedobacter tibetensis]